MINIGAGFDTLYWNLKNEGLAPSSFIELDFPDVTMQKCHYIKTRPPLLKTIHSEGIFHYVNLLLFFQNSELILEKEFCHAGGKFAPAKGNKSLAKAVARVFVACCPSRGMTLAELLAYEQCLDETLGPCVTLFYKNKTVFVMSKLTQM